MVFPLCLVWQHLKLSDISLEIRLLYSLVVDEDIKKPTREKNNSTNFKVFIAKKEKSDTFLLNDARTSNNAVIIDCLPLCSPNHYKTNNANDEDPLRNGMSENRCKV